MNSDGIKVQCLTEFRLRHSRSHQSVLLTQLHPPPPPPKMRQPVNMPALAHLPNLQDDLTPCQQWNLRVAAAINPADASDFPRKKIPVILRAIELRLVIVFRE